MRDGIVTINARPIRLAFLVNPTDVDSLQRVIEINTFLWGGKFNSIIPTFQDIPENWHHCPDMDAQDIVSGYLNNFDPDYVVPIGECADYALNYGDRDIIDHHSMFFVAAQIQGTAGYGISLFETLNHFIKNNEFELRGDKFEICMPCFSKSSYPLLSSLFGILPEGINEILEQRFGNYLEIEQIDCSISNYTEFIKAQTHHSREYVFDNQVLHRREYLMGINSLGFSRTYSGESVTFFFDAESPIDIIDYWNLRAVSRIVCPIPMQFAQDEKLSNFVLSELVENIGSIRFPKPSIRSSSVPEEEYLEFFNSIECKPFQTPYPPMWEKLPHDDKRAMYSFNSGRRYYDIHDISSNHGEILNTLSPYIRPDRSFTHTPRFANEIWFTVYNDKLIFTSVVPEGLEDLSEVCQPNNHVRASKGSLVYLVHEPEAYLQIGLPQSTVIFESWMKSRGWGFEISNAGHIVTQTIKRLGIQFFEVFAIKGIIKLLDEMKDEKSLLQTNLWRKIKTIAKQEYNTEEDIKHYVNEILERLVGAKVLQPGMEISCTNCKQSAWYSVEDADYRLRCPRCLDSFDFPYKPGAEIKWAYRRLGAFDSPNKSEGTYTTLLLLRFFCDGQMLGGAITPLMSFNLKKDNVADEDAEKIVGKEIDLALFFQLRNEKIERNGDIETIFAECKTFGSFTQRDIEKMEILGKKFPEAVLTFAKLGDLTDDEKKSLSELSCRSCNVILILTGEDILRQSLREDYKSGIMSFDRLCRITHDLYLENEE
ncbi:MAG: hypothetical protein OXU51_00760 [Candidatus Poribacteria bacterium]|nr:hypothetical protein [Candidatus Poribacteria bacterium]